jgi:hypothetical protein
MSSMFEFLEADSRPQTHVSVSVSLGVSRHDFRRAEIRHKEDGFSRWIGRQGLKPGLFWALAARLKSCPDTMPARGPSWRCVRAKLRQCPQTRSSRRREKIEKGWVLHWCLPGVVWAEFLANCDGRGGLNPPLPSHVHEVVRQPGITRVCSEKR